MRAIWMVRSRQIARKLSFWWVTLSGYDARDRSLSNRLYLVYASLFWIIWFFVAFSYFAGPAKTILQALGITPPNQAATALITLALLGWGLHQLWKATHRSPFIFSENDAHLICQAPLLGRSVALAWLLGDWFEPAALFCAGAVTFSFALVDSSLIHKVTIFDLPAYLRAALQALLLVALLHLGLMALVWAAGGLRLQRDRVLTWQPAALRLGILAVGLWLTYTLILHGLTGLGQPFWQIALWAFSFSLSAAFAAAPFVPGLLVGLAWTALGLASLAAVGVHLNLSRAAQETTQVERIETAQRYDQVELARQLAITDRLSSGHPPTRLPVRPGGWMLGWKDALQSIRSFSLSDLGGWLILGAVSLGVVLVSDPGARGLLLAIWGVLVGQRVTERLQKDLSHWSLLRLLPFSSGRLLLVDMVFPWLLTVLLAWAILSLVGGAWLLPVRLAAALLLPPLSASVSFAAASDLLRQAQSELLLNGTAPQASSVGGLLSILCLALPLGLWFLLRQTGLVGGLLAALLAVLLALLFWSLASQRMKQMD